MTQQIPKQSQTSAQNCDETKKTTDIMTKIEIIEKIADFF